MQRVCRFGDGDQGRLFFSLLHEGFVVGGFIANNDGAKPGETRKTFDVRRREGGIMRKLKGISEPDEKDVLPTQDMGRRLLDGAQTLTLEQAEHDLLVQYIERTPWKPSMMDEVSEMADFLAAADKVDAS